MARREGDVNGQPAGRVGGRVDASAMGGDDGAGDRQPESDARAVVEAIAGEATERFEQRAHQLRGHDRAGVGRR